MMYERFDDHARNVMLLSTEVAERRHHDYISTGHILLALIEYGQGAGWDVLRNLGVDTDKTQQQIEQALQNGPDLEPLQQRPHTAGDCLLSFIRSCLGVRGSGPPQTPGCMRVIENALYEARNFDHNYVGTEHLLLGLVRAEDSVAGQVLKDEGLTLEAVRNEILSVLGESKNAENHD